MHILLGRVRRDHSGFTRSRFPSVFNSVFRVCSYFALKKCYFRFAIPVECRRTLLEGISGAYKLSLDKSPILRLHSFLASIYEFENGAQLKLKLFFHDDFERTTLCETAGNWWYTLCRYHNIFIWVTFYRVPKTEIFKRAMSFCEALNCKIESPHVSFLMHQLLYQFDYMLQANKNLTVALPKSSLICWIPGLKAIKS